MQFFVGGVGTPLLRFERAGAAAAEGLSGWWEQQEGGWGGRCVACLRSSSQARAAGEEAGGTRWERVAAVAGEAGSGPSPREDPGSDGVTGAAASWFGVEGGHWLLCGRQNERETCWRTLSWPRGRGWVASGGGRSRGILDPSRKRGRTRFSTQQCI